MTGPAPHVLFGRSRGSTHSGRAKWGACRRRWKPPRLKWQQQTPPLRQPACPLPGKLGVAAEVKQTLAVFVSRTCPAALTDRTRLTVVPPPSHLALPLHHRRNAPCLAFGQGAAAAPDPLPAPEPLDLPNLRPASAEGSRGQASTPHNRRPSSGGAGASLLSPPLHLVLQSPAPRPPAAGSGGALMVVAFSNCSSNKRKMHN